MHSIVVPNIDLPEKPLTRLSGFTVGNKTRDNPWIVFSANLLE